MTLRNRTDIDHTSATTVCSSSRQLVLANKRFVVVSAHGGMIKSNWVCESGPGLIVVDLGEEEVLQDVRCC